MTDTPSQATLFLIDGNNYVFRAFYAIPNLTNSKGIRYYGRPSRVYEYEQFGYSVFVGARLKL